MPVAVAADGRIGSHRLAASVFLMALFAVLWIGLSIGVSTTLLRTFHVQGVSMSPTIQAGERVAVFLPAAPQRGDVVVLDAPPGAGIPAGVDVIKRVVAVGGDTVWCCSGHHLVVNGAAVPERYAAASQPTIARVRVPQGDLFVLGDNRLDSADSRSWGPLPGALVVGTVVARGTAASVLSPVVTGAVVALLLTLATGVLMVRRSMWWRGRRIEPGRAADRPAGAAMPS